MTTDDDRGKERAIKLVRHAAKKARTAETERDAALVFAHAQGASLRELEEASGVSHMTVKRTIERLQHAIPTT